MMCLSESSASLEFVHPSARSELASAAAVSSSLSSVSDPPSYTELASLESLYIMLNLNFNLNVFVFVVCESIASGALLAQRFGRTSTHTHTSSSYTNANTNLTLASIKT